MNIVHECKRSKLRLDREQLPLRCYLHNARDGNDAACRPYVLPSTFTPHSSIIGFSCVRPRLTNCTALELAYTIDGLELFHQLRLHSRAVYQAVMPLPIPTHLEECQCLRCGEDVDTTRGPSHKILCLDIMTHKEG